MFGQLDATISAFVKFACFFARPDQPQISWVGRDNHQKNEICCKTQQTLAFCTVHHAPGLRPFGLPAPLSTVGLILAQPKLGVLATICNLLDNNAEINRH